LQSFARLSDIIPADDQMHDHEWEVLKKVRSAILKAIEELRQAGTIKHSLEATVKLYLDSDLGNLALVKKFIDRLRGHGQAPEQFFKEYLIVSHVELAQQPTDLKESEMVGVWVEVTKADGTKCPRCWNWDQTTHEHGLCRRCQKVLAQ
jgi:isoleucyl-tRNA synthetase